MFKKKDSEPEYIKLDNHVTGSAQDAGKSKINTILKGSKLTGDINVTCDLDLSGEVEGNIHSEQDSNIIIKGICRGNIKTREGSVDLQGELVGGDVTAGGDVKISGKFNGGMVKAKGKIYVNGEFKGRLEGNEIEIGPNAKGSGELIYNEFISVSRGAQVEAQISQLQKELKAVKKSPEDAKRPDMKVINIEHHNKDAAEAK
jgi:cytoskeletal protein CcmA (bactofilin family)